MFIYCKELSSHISSFFEDDFIGNFTENFQVSFLDYFAFIMDIRHKGKNKFQPIYIACSMLSPIYYNFLTEQEREEGKKFLLEELKKMDGTVSAPEPELTPPKPSFNIPGLKHSSMNLAKAARTASSNSSCLLERKFKKDIELLELDAESTLETLQKPEESQKLLQEDPTTYWVIKEEKCNTKLPSLARGLMSCPSSSVPSERLFSIASPLSSGNTIKNTSFI